MRVYLSFTIALAVATAAVRRNDGYWNVQDPDQLYGPLRVEPFAALGFACKRTAVRLTRATATKEGLADAGACLDALQGSSGAKLGPEYFDVVPLLEVRALQYHAYGGYAVDGLMERLRAVRNRMDPGVARPAEAQETITTAVEHYAEGLLAFCRRLGWPNQSCRIKDAPKSHIGAPGALKAAASQTSFRRRLQVDAPIRPRAGARGRPGVVRAPPRARGRAQGKAIPRISSHGLGAFMTAMNVTLDGFADVIDEAQLSLELYFYARELNRADHIQMGLAPPGVGLLPPGEADVFAGRA